MERVGTSTRLPFRPYRDRRRSKCAVLFWRSASDAAGRLPVVERLAGRDGDARIGGDLPGDRDSARPRNRTAGRNRVDSRPALLGFVFRRQPVSQIASQLLRWTWIGFAVMSVSGFLLFWAEALKCYGNDAARLKLILLGLAGLNPLIFHTARGNECGCCFTRFDLGLRDC